MFQQPYARRTPGPRCAILIRRTAGAITILGCVLLAPSVALEAAPSGEADKGVDAFLPCDVPVSATIEPAIDHDFFSFSVATDEIVTITAVNDPEDPFLTPHWRLLIEGMPASSCGISTIATQDDCGPFVEASGSPVAVVLEVEEFFNDTTGAYAVHLQRLPFAKACDQVPLTADVALDASFEHFVDNDLFSLCVTEGAIVNVKVIDDPDPPILTPYWRLIDGAGSPASDCGTFTIQSGDDCGPLAESGNPYRMQVQEFFNDTAGDYSLIVSVLTGALVACPPSPLIFTDGFESGDLTAW